ncbi:MAG: DUF4402 domain-containing protein [Bdellovibrionota bacterium]
MRLRNHLIQLLITTIALNTAVYYKALAASAVAQAVQTVIAVLSISKISDLNFGTAIQGSLPKTVPPGTTENSENASFTVTGEPNRDYAIHLPANGSIKMVTSNGGSSDKEIGVSNFHSFPLGTGMIGPGGTQNLFIGATRNVILRNQVPGDYAGSFTITVVY